MSLRRVQRLLNDAGFRPAWSDRDDQTALSRPSRSTPPLYELVVVGWAGKAGEVVFADAAVSVVRGWPTKGLIEKEQLVELDGDPQRRWSLIETTDVARDWERRLAAIAGTRCEELTGRIGDELLRRTQGARDAVRSYIQRAPAAASPEEALGALRNQATAAERAEAERLRRWPGVLQIAGAEVIYDLAALLIVRESPSVEGGVPGGASDPLQNPELMWRLQLLRDGLEERWPSAPSEVHL